MGYVSLAEGSHDLWCASLPLAEAQLNQVFRETRPGQLCWGGAG